MSICACVTHGINKLMSLAVAAVKLTDGTKGENYVKSHKYAVVFCSE